LKRNRYSVLLSMLVLLALLVAACSSGNKGADGSTPPSAKSTDSTGAATPGDSAAEEPFRISIITNFDGTEVPKPDSEVELKLEELTNTKLDIRYTVGDTKQEYPVILASGDLPMVLTIPSNQQKLPYMLNMYRSGAFWDIGPYLKDYPNLASLTPVRYDNVRVDGKLYGLPKSRPLARSIFIVRQDYLDKLSLPMPKTLDEFHEALRAMTFNDPDGNSKNDTTGLVTTKSDVYLRQFTVPFGAPNVWGIRDGKMIAEHMTPEWLEGLKFMKTLYDEKIMNQDLVLMDRSIYDEKFSNGEFGFLTETTNYVTKMSDMSKVINPNAKVGMMLGFQVPGQDLRVWGGTGSNGTFVFPKSAVKTEADLKRILDFFEKTTEEEVSTLYNWGLEGKHYNLVNGKAVPIEGADWSNQVDFPFNKVLAIVPPKINAIEGEVPELLQQAADMETELDQIAVPNIAYTLSSETDSEIGAQLTQTVMDNAMQFIMGRINEDQWKKANEKWLSSGGDKITAEYQAEYDRIQAQQ